jgi:predicted DNA-binding transcriptional regulator YafY
MLKMRRADRLFRLVTLLQRRNGPITAKTIGEELEVSVRTIYRDVADLIGSGVPIDGEAGIGYQLEAGYSLPPLMLTEEEVEAAVFGLAVAEEWGDQSIATAARSLRDKINASLPASLRVILAETRIVAPSDHRGPDIMVEHTEIRRCIRDRIVLDINYSDQTGRASNRSVWPLGLVFFGKIWMLGCWCESRDAYRFFRLDRIEKLTILARRFPLRNDRRFEDMMDQQWFG